MWKGVLVEGGVGGDLRGANWIRACEFGGVFLVFVRKVVERDSSPVDIIRD